MKYVLIKIRLIQLKREIPKIGFFRTLILLLVLAVACLYAGIYYRHPQQALIISAGIAAVIVFVHFRRSDLAFITKHIQHPVQNIFSEYLLFTLPVTIPALFSKQWFYFPVMLLLLFCIASLGVNHQYKTPVPQLAKLIKPADFEWLGGVRKNYIAIAVLMVLAAAFCWLRVVPLIFLFLLTSIVLPFYQECESLQVLYAGSTNARKLLHKKLRDHSLRLSLLIVPVIIINSLVNPELLLINIGFWIVQLVLLAFAILLKYATFRPGYRNTGNSILVAFASLGCILPFLLPVPLIMSCMNYPKAIKKLQFYYDQAAGT